VFVAMSQNAITGLFGLGGVLVGEGIAQAATRRSSG
jgi:hypothetical protein